MALEMKAACERCSSAIEQTAPAWICGFECTYCPACAIELDQTCPNCEGELVQRPRRGRVRRQDVGSVHQARVSWRRGDAAFVDRRYSRVHRWTFDGGAEVRASSSPHVVPVPGSDPNAIDPEEGFIAALSSCHMLWFLDFACRAGLVVDSYEDGAEGVLQSTTVTPRDSALAERAAPARISGPPALGKITLRPVVTFAPGSEVSAEQLERLHHQAHEQCFLANALHKPPAIVIPGHAGRHEPVEFPAK